MIDKPKQYYDTRRHQLYYQWSESEYFSHQEPVYNRTREYIEALEAENAKLRELLGVMAYCNQFRRDCDGCSMNGAAGIITERAGCDALLDRLRELGIEVMQ